MELILALLMHKPFAKLHINDLKMINEHFCKCKFNKGDVLIRKGELVNSIGILCEGSATAFIEGQSQKIFDLKISDFYSVPSLLKMQVSDVTIFCNLATVSHILKADDFFKIIGKFPDIRAYFYHLAKKRSQTSKTDTARRPHSINNFTDETANYPKCILKALQIIDVNFADHISLEDISSEIGISKYYLSRLFKKTTGRSFKQHLNIRRIKAAKSLMLKEAMNVSEACYTAGFNNLSYFIRVFKQYEKIRPSDYRRRRFKKKTSFNSGYPLQTG